MAGNNNNNNNNNNKNQEPNTAPRADRWYDLSLGSSFKDPSSKFCTLRYEFKPASIDKNQPGTLHKNKDNRVTVELNNNQPGKPKLTFEGTSEDYKELDAVLFFDGESFRLERLHRAVKRLRYNRLPGESAGVTTSLGPESSSPPLAKVSKYQPINKSLPLPMPVEIEHIEVGDFRSSGAKYKKEKVDSFVAQPKPSVISPEQKDNELDEQLDIVDEEIDILNDDEEENIDILGNDNTNAEKVNFTGIDINIPHQNETDEEIADVDISDDEDKGPSAAEALKAQLNPEGGERNKQTSSSSGSSGSESSGSSSRSGSGTRSSTSNSESSDADSVTSI